MKPTLRLLIAPLLLLAFTGMAKRPDFIVRFFVETNERDTERFASPVTLKYPPRPAFIARVPMVSERDIKGIYPFHTLDGTWGCAFQLDPSGRLRLQTNSVENRGRAVVAYVGTKLGTHQVIDMIIDRQIADGVITIQHGLTIREIEALQDRYPNLAVAKRAKAVEPTRPSTMPRSDL